MSTAINDPSINEGAPLLPQPTKKGLTAHWSNTKWIIVLTISCGGAILGGLGQTIGLPLFISTFASKDGDLLTGVYFVLFFASLMFNVFFWPWSIYLHFTNQIPAEMWKFTFKNHWMFIAIGVFDAVNGFGVVFSSALSRVPAPLQAILLQSVIPFTLFLSKPLLKKRYTNWQILGACVVLMGVVVSLIPPAYDTATGATGDSVEKKNWFWPIVLIAACLPGVMMNILEEMVFEAHPRYNVTLLLAWESLWQLLFVIAFFWLDIIPKFGTSDSVHEWWNKLEGGFQCFFAPDTIDGPRCDYSALLGVLFVTSYILNYTFASYLMKFASANFNAIVAAFVPPTAVIFWFIFPGVNHWAGGKPYGTLDKIFNPLALPFIIVGIAMFRWFEHKSVQESAVEEISQGDTEERSLVEERSSYQYQI